MNFLENDLFAWLESEKSDRFVEPFIAKLPILSRDIFELKKLSDKSFWLIFAIILQVHMVRKISFFHKHV